MNQTASPTEDTMEAMVIHGPGDWGLETTSVPECPPRGMLVEVIACSLCGSDRRTLEVGHPKISYPWILGHEVSARVVELGEHFQGRWEVGDVLAVGPTVYCGECAFCLEYQYELCDNIRELSKQWRGGYARYMAIPEESIRWGVIERVPDDLDPRLAGVAEPISSCVNAQELGEVGFGDTVVILGDGPIGAVHAALAKARGADDVIVSGKYDFKLSKARELGADHTIDLREEDVIEAVRDRTDGLGADVVITANSSPQAQIDGVKMARKGGRILLFGGLPSDQSKPGIDTNDVHYRGLRLIGATIFAPRHYRKSLSLMQDGTIPVDKLVTHTLPLQQFERGIELANRGEALKLIYLPGETS